MTNVINRQDRSKKEKGKTKWGNQNTSKSTFHQPKQYVPPPSASKIKNKKMKTLISHSNFDSNLSCEKVQNAYHENYRGTNSMQMPSGTLL